MSERCKHIEKNGFRCGSYAFNLYKDGIDQGNLCDVHYWQEKAQRTWVDLTDKEIDNINYTSAHMLAREVLAKFKEKNT